MSGLMSAEEAVRSVWFCSGQPSSEQVAAGQADVGQADVEQTDAEQIDDDRGRDVQCGAIA
jgi:hypothetical protein